MAVGTWRQWAAIGCDGLPYVLASRIIEEIFFYQVGRRQFDGITEFSTHISHISLTGHVDNPEDGRKYKDILMLKVHMKKAIKYIYTCMYEVLNYFMVRL